MTLDAAIDLVVAERPGRTYRELAERIEQAGLYLKRDGLPAGSGQINARVKSARYRDRYRIDDGGLVWSASRPH
jgi:hypothetical protein